MKKLFTFTLVLVVNFGFSQERIPRKIFMKVNEIHDLIDKNKIEKAVANTIEVCSEGKQLWVSQMHNNFAQQVNKDSKGAHLYFSELQKLEIDEIKTLSYPLYLWSQSFELDELSSQEILAVYPEVLKQAKFEAKTETYILLTLKNLAAKDLISDEELKTGIQACIANLEPKVTDTNFLTNKLESKANTWRKYLLSYSYFLLSEIEPTNKEGNFKKAFAYAPDIVDQSNAGYFYDNLLLTGSTDMLNVPVKYYNFLVETESTEDEIKLVLEKMAFTTPSDNYLTILKKHIKNSDEEINFKEYWRSVFNKKATPLNNAMKTELTSLLGENLDQSWWFIDFWGTWCKPCLEDLPLVEEFYTSASKLTKKNINVQTLSFKSSNLDKFMSKNQYSFPVVEIDEHSIEIFKISSFPTKILISPEGNYIKLKSSKKWHTYLTNYTLLNQD